MIILASKSPRRKELLEQIGLEFSIVVQPVKEYSKEDFKDPIILATKNSELKAKAIKKDENTIIISADTVVSIDGEILGKPKDEIEAKRFLKMLSGKTHDVITGITIYKNGEYITDYAITKVKVMPLSEFEIDEYIKTKDPMDKAGAYGIQGVFAKYIVGISGCYFNVVGLPLNKLYEMLNEGKKNE